MQLYTHVEYACNAYSSCESVKTVQETSAMSQAEGFFDYQVRAGGRVPMHSVLRFEPSWSMAASAASTSSLIALPRYR